MKLCILSPEGMYTFLSASEKQNKRIIKIFTSSKENVHNINEEGCQYRTKVGIKNLPSCDGDLSQEVELHVNFFNTEVAITAYSVIDSENKTYVRAAMLAVIVVNVILCIMSECIAIHYHITICKLKRHIL